MFFGLWKRDSFPTLLFITHAKAGSTWIDGILRTLFGRRVAPREYQLPDFERSRGRIFTVFLTREELLARPALAGAKRFVLLRDLRDTLVSRYFSLRNSHADDPAGIITALRSELLRLDTRQGLRRILDDPGMIDTIAIHRSWIESGEAFWRYEELIREDVPLLRRLFLETLQLPVAPAELERAVLAHRFENVYGRKLGEEDASSHGRKGAPGDWRNHFTPELAEEFHRRCGDLLLAGGFESDPEWFRLGAPVG